MDDRKKKKSIWPGILTFLLLTVILIIFIRHTDENVFELMGETGPSMILVLLVCCILILLLDALPYYGAYGGENTAFSYGDALMLTNLLHFGKTALIGGGTMPLQGLYLYKKEVMPGQFVGITAALYIVQKTSVLLYGLACIALQGSRLGEIFPGAAGYLIYSCAFCIVMIVALILLCTSGHVCRLACRLIGKLPSSPKWTRRKEKLTGQVTVLYEETHTLFREPKKLLQLLTFNFLRLAVHYSIPFAVAKMMGAGACTFSDAQTLSAVMLLLSNALPNIAGMGSVEFSFIQAFSGLLGPYTAAVLIYYRCATYYFPFLVSLVIVFFSRKKILPEKGTENRPG